MHHDRFLKAGTRIFAVSVDSPGRNAALVEKLSLPFPLLSDPDRAAVIDPYGLADPHDERNIAIPAIVLVTPDRQAAFRFVSRDFADRLPEEEILEKAAGLGLAATSQKEPAVADPEPGERSLSPEQLRLYFRAARFAAYALGRRHRSYEDVKADSKAFVAEMDRYTTALDWLSAAHRS